MNLTKEHWTKADIAPFHEYEKSFSKGEESGKWEQRIVNTTLPCLAIGAPTTSKIVNEIARGNFKEFIDLWVWDNFTDVAIIGSLICRIKDFIEMKKYLVKYANKIDNWASCDLLKFKITAENKPQFYELTQEFIRSKKTFVRRIGVTILFKFIDDEYIYKIFATLNFLSNEQEYYVNMACAWLFAECFTKKREKTLEFLKTHKMNAFVINKGVQKCRDSFRISPADKQMLLKFKVK